VQAGQPGDLGAAVAGCRLEEGVAVHHSLDDAAHLVDLAPVARDDSEQGLVAAFGGIGWFVRPPSSRRQLGDVGGQVAQEAPDQANRVVFVLGQVVHDAASQVYLVAAQLFLGLLLAQRALDQGRSPDHHL
jgi:hypothetical protein